MIRGAVSAKDEGSVSPGKDRPTGLSPAAKSEVMTLQQVADYLKCHYSTAFRLLRRGELPGFRLCGSGSDWRFLRSEIDNWIVQRQGQPYTPKRPKRRSVNSANPRR
jgi:excisionase family DNA binding protein